jgi:hypothetical protein
MRRSTTYGLVVLSLLAWLSLAGCTVPVDGLTGVSVTDTGRLAIVIAWCKRPPDGFSVYHYASSAEDAPDVTDVDYDAPPLTGDHILVDLLDPGGDWTAHTAAVTTLDPATEYHAYSGTKDNSYSTAAVAFRGGVATTLTPGQVLVQVLPDRDANNWVDAIVSMGEFVAKAHAIC